MQQKCALFDFDGVIANTEPLYDYFWNDAAKRYGLKIPNFASLIKGTVMKDLQQKYFSYLSEEDKERMCRECSEYELHMPLNEIPGSIAFLQLLKDNGIQTALVTSSGEVKVERIVRDLKMEKLFDTIISADKILHGKPDPMCYLLAADELHRKPEECLVFEDSLAGIESATKAGMRTIGLSTTCKADKIRDKVWKVIPNFLGLTIADFLSW